MAGRTLTVYLAADTSKFKAGMTGAAAEMSTLDNKINSFGNNLSGMLGPALIGATAAAGAFAVKFGVDGVQAAMADEAAASKLAQTMTNLGLAHDTSKVEAMIDALQRQTGVADDELRPAYGRLITTLGDTGRATDTLKLAMDISAGTGKDLQTVVGALAKAYDGNTGALGRLGAGLDADLIKSKDMDAITQALASTFAGQADKAASTYQGSINRLSIGFDELKESFGAGFLSGLGEADTATGDLSTSMQELEPLLASVGGIIGDNAKNLADLIGYAADAKSAIDDLTESMSWAEPVMKSMAAATQNLLSPLRLVSELAGGAKSAIDSLLGRSSAVQSFATGPINSIGGGVFR